MNYISRSFNLSDKRIMDELKMMKKGIFALASLITIPLVIHSGFVRADGSADYMLNCPPREFERCWSKYQANKNTEWQNIKNTYNAMLNACSRKDMYQCFADFAPDYQVKQLNGTLINLQQLRQYTQQLWQQTSQYRESAYIIRRDVGREYAKVMGIEYIDATIPGSGNLRQESTFEQTWRRTSNGWKLVYAKVLDQKVSRGGQSPRQANSQYPAVPLPPSTSLQQQFDFVWQMPRFWNP
jgi:hypothetical protein